MKKLLPYALLASVCGCGERAGTVAPETAIAASTQSQDTSEAPFEAQLGAVIECMNEASPRIAEAAERYFSWADRDDGPSCKETRVYGTLMPSPYGEQRCQKAQEAVAGLDGEYANFKRATLAYTAAYAELAPLVTRIYRYYEQQDYQDDACAQGKELHARYMQISAQFADAEQALRDSVNDHEARIAERMLEDIEKSEGKGARWYIQNSMIEAKELLSSIDENTGELDRAAYLERFAAFEKSHLAFQEFGEQHKDQMPYWASDFLGADEKLYTQAKIAKREFAEGNVKPGRINVLVGHYNALIQGYNNLPNGR